MSSSPIYCNRRPFVSDSECNRGSVDTTQFIDLPFCDSFAPTMPAIPPEVIDTPVNLTIPPPCTCFNMTYKMGSIKYKKTGSATNSYGSGWMSADGDCCEGNYISHINLRVPCPISGEGGSKKIKVSADYATNGIGASASYITIGDSCEIDPKNVDLKLRIGCPVKSSDATMKIGVGYGSTAVSETKKYIQSNTGDNCSIKPLSPEFDLKLPCPYNGVTGSMTIALNYDSPKSGTETFISGNTGDNCSITPLSPSFNLGLPCPIKAQEKTKKVHIDYKWSEDVEQSSNSYISADQSNCAIEPYNINYKIKIRCPIVGEEQIRIRPTIGYGDEFNVPNYIDLAKRNTNNASCFASFLDTNLNIKIPCPTNKSNLVFSVVNSTNYDDCEDKIEINDSFSDYKRKVKIILKRASGNNDCFSILKDVKYNVSEHFFMVKYMNICLCNGRINTIESGSWENMTGGQTVEETT